MILDERILDSLARLFKLLSDSNRMRILFAIGKEKKSVSEIMSETSLPQTLVSFHLRPLRESGIVATERKGPFIYYSVSDPILIDLLISLSGITPPGESNVEVNFCFPPMRFMQRWMKWIKEGSTMDEKSCGPGMGMEMMKKMMEGQGGFSLPMMERWMQMCEQMAGTVIEIGRLAGFASPELRGLFEEWIKALEGEIIDILKEKGSCPPAELAAQLKLSEESVLFLIGKLVREGKLKINGVKL